MRYFFYLSYKGTNYNGWQAQKAGKGEGIQSVIENALSLILSKNTKIVGSGRTDSGVHALQQVFHVDINQKIDIPLLKYKLNSFLPPDIAIHKILPVTEDAHARFSAIRRSYVYKIYFEKKPFLTKRAYLCPTKVEKELMNEISSLIIGKHDFQSFSRVKTDVNHFSCEVFEAKWFLKNDILAFYIEANRFLRNMVRALVGTMLLVGMKKMTVKEFEKVMQSKDRKKAGASAPACGLYLNEVKYPKELFM